ncbi:unnamed protein product [Sphagnum balticum]
MDYHRLTLLGFLYLLDAGLQQQRLSASLFPHDNDAVVPTQPLTHNVPILLQLLRTVNALHSTILVVSVLANFSSTDSKRQRVSSSRDRYAEYCFKYLCPPLQIKVGADSLHQIEPKLLLVCRITNEGERTPHQSDLGRGKHLLVSLSPSLVASLLNSCHSLPYELLLRFQLFGPFANNTVDVDVLVVHKDHPHSGYGRWRCELQVVSLEDKVDIAAKGDTLTSGESQQMIVVQHAI